MLTYHIWLRVVIGVVMAPRVSSLMIGADLIDCPCSLSDAVTAVEIEVLHNLFDTYSHPCPLVAWLFCDLEGHIVVDFAERLASEADRVAS